MIRTLFLMLASVLAVSGQVYVKSNSWSNYWKANGKTKLISVSHWPHVYPSSNQFTNVASKINNTISYELSGGFLTSGKTIDSANSGRPIDADLSFSSFKVRTKNENLLSISIIREWYAGTGSHNEAETYYSFDLQTGQKIHVSDLFTNSGIQSIASRLWDYWDAYERDGGGSIGYPLAQMLKESNSTLNDAYVYGILGDGFYVRGTNLILLKNSSDHYRVDKYQSFAYSINVLKPYLSAYGRKILLHEQNNAEPRLHFFNTLFTGVIGTYPIHLRFDYSKWVDVSDTTNHETTATYWYSKYRKEIPLSGTIKGNRVTLYNVDPYIFVHNIDDGSTIRGDTIETISAKITPTGLVGTWKSKGKTLPFKVSLE